MKHTFRRGIHPPHNKSATASQGIQTFPAPERVSIALSQHIGAPATPVVSVGDTVKMGQLIAEASGAFSASVFSSVSGVVESIENLVTIGGRKAPHIVIKNDFLDEPCYLAPLTERTKEAIIERVRESGLVGLGGAGFPLAIKLSPRKKVDTVVINAAECEPYITCDYRILLEKTKAFVQGVALLAIAVEAEHIIIGIEDNKSDCAPLVKAECEAQGVDATVMVLPTKYPQGAEKQLIYATTGRSVPQGGLPSDVGVNVHNVHTAYSLQQAVYEGKTCYERVLTVTGSACARPGNYLVRNGTPVSSLVEHCGLLVTEQDVAEAKKAMDGADKALAEAKAQKKVTSALRGAARKARREYEKKHKASLAKMVSGGPMMGIAFSDARATVVKTTSCLLLMAHAEADKPNPSPCINCGRCAKACPMSLMPMFIDSYAIAGDWQGAKKYGAMDCILCGCCAYVCPAKRTLTQSFAVAKKVIKEKGV